MLGDAVVEAGADGEETAEERDVRWTFVRLQAPVCCR